VRLGCRMEKVDDRARFHLAFPFGTDFATFVVEENLLGIPSIPFQGDRMFDSVEESLDLAKGNNRFDVPC